MIQHEDVSLYFIDPREIEWKPGAKSRDGERVKLMPYADPRAYMDRLDRLDPNWSDERQVHLAGNKIVAVCTVILNGKRRSAVGEAELVTTQRGKEADNTMAATAADAQAFKRACAAHGVGRELYFTQDVWVPAEEAKDYQYGRKQAPLVFVGPYRFLNQHVQELIASIGDQPSRNRQPRQSAQRPAPNGNGRSNGNGHQPAAEPQPQANGDPGNYVIPFGKNQGKTLSEVSRKALEWYAQEMQPNTQRGRELQLKAQQYLEALAVAA